MKSRLLCLLAFAATLCAAGGLAATPAWGGVIERLIPSSASAGLDGTVAKLSDAPVDFKTAQKWFKLSQGTDNQDLRQKFLRLSAAALLYSRKTEYYHGSVKPMMTGAQQFEQSLRSDCDECKAGKVDVKCKHCRGTGKCQFAGCENGYNIVRVKKFGEMAKSADGSAPTFKECGSCGGTGKCRYCEGLGTLEEQCQKCGGKGWTVKPADVLSVYRGLTTETLRHVSDLRKAARRKMVFLTMGAVVCLTFLLWLFWHPDWRGRTGARR